MFTRRLSSTQNKMVLQTKAFQPGPLGITLDWATGKVTKVLPDFPGGRASVAVGWQFKELNGFPFSKELLLKLVGGKRAFKATFAAARIATPPTPRGSRCGTGRGSGVDMQHSDSFSSSVNGSVIGAASADTDKCGVCRSRFSLTVWRHHCRICGRCVCHDCSPHQVRMDQHLEALQRACKTCVDLESASRNTELVGSVYAAASRLSALHSAGGEVPQPPLVASGNLGQAIAQLQQSVVDLEDADQSRGTRLERAEALAAERSAECAAIAELMAKSSHQHRWATERLVETTIRLGHICPGASSSSGIGGTPTFGGTYPEMTLVQAVSACEDACRMLQQRADMRGKDTNAKQAIEAGIWEKDGASCSICQRRIGKRVLNRRHHCRMCGRCVCSSCSPSMVQLDPKSGPQRMCVLCVDGAFGSKGAAVEVDLSDEGASGGLSFEGP